MEKSVGRDISLDAAKGIGIILVVVGHCSLDILGIFPYSFHMPLFFFISGYLFSQKDSVPYVLSKVKKLLVPMYAYLIAYSIILYLLIQLDLYSGVYPDWLDAVMINPFFDALKIPFTSTLWFVSCLFVASLLFHLYLKYSKGSPVFSAVLAVLLIVSLIHVPSWTGYGYCARALIAFAWLCLGYSFRRLEHKLSLLYWLLIALIVFWGCQRYAEKNFLMIVNEYNGAVFGPLLFGISGSILVLCLVRILAKPLQEFLASLGKESFHIMANHLFIFFLLNLMFLGLLDDTSWFTGLDCFPNFQSRYVYSLIGLLVPWFVMKKVRSWRRH